MERGFEFELTDTICQCLDFGRYQDAGKALPLIDDKIGSAKQEELSPGAQVSQHDVAPPAGIVAWNLAREFVNLALQAAI